MMIYDLPPAIPNPTNANSAENQAPLRKVSQALEASFLAEMLKSSGVGKTRDSYGGGVGEDGFSSFLINAQADQIVKAGGIGLAEQIFNSLKNKVPSND